MQTTLRHEGGGNHPLDAPELSNEVALVGEPDCEGDLRGTVAGTEQLPGVEHAHQGLVGMGWESDSGRDDVGSPRGAQSTTIPR